MGNWHERQSAYQNGAIWSKIQSRHDDYKAGRYATDVNTSFVQLRGDLLQKNLADSWRLSAGPMLTPGHQSSKHKDNARSIRSELSVDVGKNVIQAYGVGGRLNQRLNACAQVKYSHSFGTGAEGYSGNIGLDDQF